MSADCVHVKYTLQRSRAKTAKTIAGLELLCINVFYSAQVFVAINASHLVLAANEEQTIYPISLNEANTSHTSFPNTFLGGTISNLRWLAHGPPSFIGCTEDVQINGEWVRK